MGNRLLENGMRRLLENGTYLALESDPVATTLVWPKCSGGWNDRTGITAADFAGSLCCSQLTQYSCGESGLLMVVADGTQAGASIDLVIVLWDERGCVLSAWNGTIRLSKCLTNPAGNYVASDGVLSLPVSAACFYSLAVRALTGGTFSLHSKVF